MQLKKGYEMELILLLLYAYLLGSIPSALWIGKLFYKMDIREHGSGNLGGTNTFRVLGKKAGLAVTSLDISKRDSSSTFAVIALFRIYERSSAHSGCACSRWTYVSRFRTI